MQCTHIRIVASQRVRLALRCSYSQTWRLLSETPRERRKDLPPTQHTAESPDIPYVLKSGAGVFLGMSVLSGVHFGLAEGHAMTMILGSFGASSLLVFGAPSAPFSQPRNVMGGHFLAACCGIGAEQVLVGPVGEAIAAPCAVSLSLMAMLLARCVHPPAGGTALIALFGSPAIHDLGWLLLVPVTLGPGVLVLTASLFHRLTGGRYPV